MHMAVSLSTKRNETQQKAEETISLCFLLGFYLFHGNMAAKAAPLRRDSLPMQIHFSAMHEETHRTAVKGGYKL